MGAAADRRRRRVASLARRLQELRQEGVHAAQGLISRAGSERRSARRPSLEREFRRLVEEAERLEAEEARHEPPAERQIEDRIERVGRQIAEALADRDEWVRESLQGHRRRAEDRRELESLKEELERLTAELMRCAELVRRLPRGDERPEMRRVLKMLRLSGS